MAKDFALRHDIAAAEFHYYLSGAVGPAEDYVDLLDLLYGGRPNDTVYIHLNTPGGSLDTTLQILNAINTSASQVVTVADGSVASAGTLILFSGDGIMINPFSYAMLHDGAEGLIGKLSENLKQAQFSSRFVRELCHHVYQPFFTEEEVDSILDGKDMWLTATELNERAVKAAKQQEEEINAE